MKKIFKKINQLKNDDPENIANKIIKVLEGK